MNVEQLALEILRTLSDRINVEQDRELTMSEAAMLRGISESLLRKRITHVAAWREAFFVSGTSKELRTTMRRLRSAEEKLALSNDLKNKLTT